MSITTKIQELLSKRGVNKLSELTVDEKVEYDRWQSIVDGSEVTVEKMKEFCQSQIKLIEGRYASGDTTDKQDVFLRASLHIYLNLLDMINSPEISRVNLEKHLTNLLKQ
jgi:hypothetical protein